MEAELNFLQTAKKTLLEDKGLFSSDFSRWVSSWTDSVEYYFGDKPLKPPPEVELVEHTGGIHELPEDNPEMLGGHHEEKLNEDEEAEWGADDDLPGGLAEEDLDLGVAEELQAPVPEWGSQQYIDQLAAREAAQLEEMGIEMQTVELGPEVVADTSEVLADMAEAAEIVAEATEATAMGILGGVAMGALGAAAMVGATIGMDELLGYLKKKKRVFHEADDDPWMGYVGYFVLGRIWYPMYVDMVSHDHKIVTIAWKDMTGFLRFTNVNRSPRLQYYDPEKPDVGNNVNDSRLRFLHPLVRFIVPKMPKVILKNGKAMNIPYYRQYPVGTSVKMIKTGQRGRIVRGMIFGNNQGYNKDGTYDKYRIRVGGNFVYATPAAFKVRRVVPKHGAKGKLGRWLPNRQKPKGIRKKTVLAILHSKAREEVYARKKRDAEIKKVSEERNTTDRVSRKIIAAEKAKKKHDQTAAHCEAMLAKAKRQSARAEKELKAEVAQAKLQGDTEVKRMQTELRDSVRAGAMAQWAAEDEAKELRKELAEQNNFNQHSESDPVALPVKHVDHDFVQQHNPGRASYIDSQGQFHTRGGIGRRRLVGSGADNAWDFLVTTFFNQPSGGQAGKIVGDMGGKRGVPNLRTPDTHDNEVINMWKNVLYHWVRANTELGDWRQAEGRKHWEEFKQYVASGQNPNIHGDPPKGYSNLLQAYMYMCAAGYHRSQFIANDSENVTNATEQELFAAQVEHGYSEAQQSGSGSELTTAKSKSKTRSPTPTLSEYALRQGPPVNYMEPGTLSGLHTNDQEFANTQERLDFENANRASSSIGQRWEVALLPYNSTDLATWLPPIVKVLPPIIYLNTRHMAFNKNAYFARSTDKFHEGPAHVGRSVVFGEGTQEEQTAGWESHFVGLFDAYQREWQETYGWKRPTWLDLKRIPNTPDHQQHTYCNEVRAQVILPQFLARWGDRLLNMCFEDTIRRREESPDQPGEFRLMVVSEEIEYEGVTYDSVFDLFHKELPKGEVSDMTQTFGRRGQGGQAANNFTRYVLDGFLILSPIDILVLQDYTAETNWVASFAKYLETETESRVTDAHYLQPWIFCLTHMVAEGVIREGSEEDLQKMFIIIEKMRYWMWNRVRPDLSSAPNYSLPTFVAWTGQSQVHERGRFAEFCWFLASTGGNFNIPTAGTFFPYCAWSRDISHEVNKEFGLSMSDETAAELLSRFRDLKTLDCQARQEVMHAHAGPLFPMPKTALSETLDFVPHSDRMSLTSVTGSSTVPAPTPKRRNRKPRPPSLAAIPEGSEHSHDVRLLAQPFGTKSFLEGLEAVPSYQLDVPAHVSPDPSVFTPASNRSEPMLNQGTRTKTRSRTKTISPDPPAPGDPYVIQEYAPTTDLPFNYMPYIVLGVVLIGLAYITDER